VKNVKSQVLKIIPLSLPHQKIFTHTNYDAIENFEKVTQVQWKIFVKFVLRSSPPMFCTKIPKFCTLKREKSSQK
jgi:hypothetical protein